MEAESSPSVSAQGVKQLCGYPPGYQAYLAGTLTGCSNTIKIYFDNYRIEFIKVEPWKIIKLCWTL